LHSSDIGEKWGTVGQCISYLYILRRLMTQSGEKYCTIFSLNFVYLF